MGGSGSGGMGGSAGGMGGHHGDRKMVKRQMSGMMGNSGSGTKSSGSGGMSMSNAGWTHAMHLHLVASVFFSDHRDLTLIPTGHENRLSSKGGPVKS